MTTDVRESLVNEQFVLFTTYKKSGEAVATPVWIAAVGADQLGFTTSDSTWKVKRLGRNNSALLQPCSRMGAPTEGSVITPVTAEVVAQGPLVEQVQSAIKTKYGFQVTLIHTVQSVLAKFKKPKDRPTTAGNNVVIVISFHAFDDAAEGA